MLVGALPRADRAGGEVIGTGRPRSGPILQVITDNDRRGGQVFASDLERVLLERDIEVRTVALAPASQVSGLDYEVLGPTRRHPRTLSSLRRAMRDSSVVIGHGSTTLPACAIAGAGLRVPFLYRQISEQLFWANTWGRQWRTRAALRRATRVTALWKGAAEVLQSEFGVEAERITIIPNGVPEERCAPAGGGEREQARQRFGLDPDRPVLLAIGALAPEKGVDTLVRAMGSPGLSSWQLLVVGAGPERDRLEALAAASRPEDVAFHEPVDSAREAFLAADVVGLTSRGGDSMPAVLIEAGLMGIPVVATPIEGIVDIVDDGRTGELVPLDDPVATAEAVARCLRSADLMGEAARRHCLERFEIETVATQWAQLLNEVRRQGREGGASA